MFKLKDIDPRNWILTLFIRDDGERFLLGDISYEFNESQKHFSAPSIDNDTVEVQGTDGLMLAGQVRRPTTQEFNGYIGDASMARETIEARRRAFFAFFLARHTYTVIYIFANEKAIQRKNGFLVDAPEVKELWQIHPTYHVALNFEDVNYYNYSEDDNGDEVFSSIYKLINTRSASGGLIWDAVGVVWQDGLSYNYASASGKIITIEDAVAGALMTTAIYGDSVQNGTPTHDSPVAIQSVTGLNTIHVDRESLVKLEDFTLGYFNNSGNVIPDSALGEMYSKEFLVDGEAVYSMQVIDSGYVGEMWFAVASYDSSGNFISRLAVGGSGKGYRSYAASFTLPSNAKTAIVMARGLATAKHVLVYKTNTAQSSTNRSINLGKNLFDTSAQTWTNQTIDGAGNTTSSGNSALTGAFTRVDSGIQYTLQLSPISGTYQNIVIFFDASKNFISCTQPTRTTLEDGRVITTFATPAKALYIKFTIYNANGITIANFPDNYCENIQLEKGATATKYAPYFEPIELNKLGDYQDRIYKAEDGWHLYKATRTINPYNGETVDGDYLSTTGQLSTGAQVVYTLTTPTDELITNTALISDLDNLANLRTYEGHNVIATETQNLTPTIDVESADRVDENTGAEWEAGAGETQNTITIESADVVYPVLTIIGFASSVIIENTTTGDILEYVGNIADGQTLIIDCQNQTATLNGVNTLGNLTGDWLRLKPGENRVIYDANTDDNSSATIEWQEIVG